MTPNGLVAPLVDAVAALHPQLRERQWVSLAICVLDAVYRIGAHYDYHVVPVVRRVATDFGVDTLAAPPSASISSADPVPLDTLLKRYKDPEALIAATDNREYTSTRGGIRKADAVLRYAKILASHGVTSLPDGRAALSDAQRAEEIDRALRRVPGEGVAGVRRGYLWMLVGDQTVGAADRMILRWLARHGFDTDAEGARALLYEAPDSLTVRFGRVVSTWEVDHAICRAARLG